MKSNLYALILLLSVAQSPYIESADTLWRASFATGAAVTGLCGGGLLWKTMAHSTFPAKTNLKKKVSGADEQSGFNYSLKQVQKFLTEPHVCLGASIGLLSLSAFFLHKATKS